MHPSSKFFIPPSNTHRVFSLIECNINRYCVHFLEREKLMQYTLLPRIQLLKALLLCHHHGNVQAPVHSINKLHIGFSELHINNSI